MKGGDRESIVLPAKELNVKHRGLTLASVVGQGHCCSVVIVNTKNIVQELTLGSSIPLHRVCGSCHVLCAVSSGARVVVVCRVRPRAAC